MSLEEINANSLRRVASLLKNDLKTTLELGKQAQEFAKKVPQYGSDHNNPYVYAAAVHLQHFYTSLETIFKRVIKEFEGSMPHGESWHQELLELVFIEIENVRPPLISESIKKELSELRRFRHVVRHGYEYDLDWNQIQPLIESLDKIIPRLKKDIKQFNLFLLETAEELEKN